MSGQRRWKGASLLAALLVLTGVATGWGFSLTPAGVEQTAEAVPVMVEAERMHYRRATEQIEASGSVVARRQGATLRVDRLLWYRLTGEVVGEGNVLLEDGNNRLSAHRIQLNLLTRTGRIEQGEVSLSQEGRQAIHLSGDLIEQTGADRYVANNGIFSSCACRKGRRRPWSVAASRLTVKTGGNLIARNVRFRVLDVPVFYTPVFFFPTEARQTGLLVPTMDTDTRNGLRLIQPFYWAMTPSQDLTVALDLRTQRGMGTDLWYRYRPSQQSIGSVRISGLKDRQDGRVKGELKWLHQTRSDRGWSTYANVHTVNDRDYFRELGDVTEERTAEGLESNLLASRTGTRLALTGLIRKTTRLAASTADVVQYLPRVRAELHDQNIVGSGLWLGGSLDGAYLFRQSGSSVVRLDANPRVRARHRLWGGRLMAQAHSEARLIAYHVAATRKGPTLNRAFPTEVSLSGQAAGRLLGRVHRLVPTLRYRWVPVQNGDPASFDALERLQREHVAAAELAQSYRKARLRISVPYDLDDHRLLPVRTELDASAGAVRLHLDSLYRADDNQLERLTADVAMDLPGGALRLGQLFDRGRVTVGTPLSVDTPLGEALGQRVNFGRVAVRLGPWKGWQLSQRSDYDWQDDRLAEARYAVAYGGSCWSLSVAYSDLPDRNVVRFRLTLTGDIRSAIKDDFDRF